MKASFFFQPRPRIQRRSSVLIITLVVLTAITILLVAFVGISTRDRSASQNYAQSLRAEQIGLGGLDQVVAQLQAEITDTIRSLPNGSGTNQIYVPNQALYAVPQRMNGLPATLPTLVKISTNALFFTPAAGTDNANASLASPIPTTALSVNGRSVSVTRWNKPQLLTSTAAFPVPNWVFVSRAGPQVLSSFTSTLADPTLSNQSYIVGRYAYTVYDTSGLIDVNVAGNPSTSSATNNGALPFADMTQLSSQISQSDVDKLVQWRNAATYSSYNTYVTNQWATNGFTQVANGDTTFLSRQDLLTYVQQQNPDLSTALPYLTTFSRELNGPTWAPTTNYAAPYDYQNHEYDSTLVGNTPTYNNVFILNPKVATPFTRNNGLPAVAGEPLVKYRFPLDKLALFNISNPSAQNLDDIARYFGLDPAPDSNSTYHHWIYPTTNSKYLHPSTSTGILTLNEVANLATGREPDFFEMLQAGILQGSLAEKPLAGQTSARTDYLTTSDLSVVLSHGADPDTKITYQLLRIGANIIDQWKSDNYPTTIQFTPVAVNVYGTEDLPYLNQVLFKIYNGGTTASPGPWDLCLYYEMWNPHQPCPNTTTTPTHFQIVPCSVGQPDTYSFIMKDRNYGGAWFWDGTNTWSDEHKAPPQAHFIPISQSDPANTKGTIAFTATSGSYREPAVIANGTGTQSTYGNWTPSTPVTAIHLTQASQIPPTNYSTLGENTHENTNWGTGSPLAGAVGSPLSGGGWEPQLDYTLTLLLQYQDGGGAWHTYATLAGFDNGLNTYNGENEQGVTTTTATVNAYAVLKIDARTSRFGPGIVMNAAGTDANTGALPAASMTAVPNKFRVGNPAPFIGAPDPGPGLTAPYRIDMWAANNPTLAPSSFQDPSLNAAAPYNIPYYADADGALRGGDAKYGYVQKNSPLFAPPSATSTNPARPIILHRPFTSVGELGYAFRDDPWRTLDLFTPDSPDAALLDLFTLSDAPVLAGRVNPNTPYANVIAALLTGAAQDGVTTTTSLLTSTSALNIGEAMTNATTTTPFMNRSLLATSLMTNSAVVAALPSGIKAQREGVIRALAESSNTRTWNFLIDIVAQSGMYPGQQSNLSLANFVVTGERRYWLHVAIDRYTGQVVDKKLEVVNE